MNRKLELIVGNLLLLCLLLMFSISLFNLFYDKDKGMQDLAQAIEDADIDYLTSHIEIEGRDEPLTIAQVANITAIIRERYRGIDELKSLYVPSLKDRRIDLSYEPAEDELEDSNIRIEKRGKEKLIYDKYVLVLKPYDLHIRTDFPESIVYIDDVEIGIVDKDTMTLTVSDVLPGWYDIGVSNKGEYFEAENFESIECFQMYNRDIESFIPLDAYYIDVYSNVEGAKLYIDGKETDTSLPIDYNSPYRLGPITIDRNIEIQAKVKIDGKVYESDKKTLDNSYDSYELYIEEPEPVYTIPESQDNQNPFEEYDYEESQFHDPLEDELQVELDIINTISRYQVNLVEGINNNDTSYLSEVEPGSPLMDAQIGLIQRLNEKGTKEELLDYKVSQVNRVSPDIFEAKVFEVHRLIYKDGSEKTVENWWTYTIVFDGYYGPYLRDLRRPD